MLQNPTWQSGRTAPLLLRGVPDVAGNADPVTGINVRVNGNDRVSGGTSAVAPQWAALTAVLSQALEKKASFFIPLLYANMGCVHRPWFAQRHKAVGASVRRLSNKPHLALERSWLRGHSSASANPLIRRRPCFTDSLFKPTIQCTMRHQTTLRHHRLPISRQVTISSPGSRCRTSLLGVPVRHFISMDSG